MTKEAYDQDALLSYEDLAVLITTSPAKEAVDRYISDYESVNVVRNATADIDKISQITQLSKRVIPQYLDLVPQYQLQTMDANIANSSSNDETTYQ